MRTTAEQVDEAIFAAAEHLFAELGYDQTSNQLIADAAGVPVEEVVRHGGRLGLYNAVMENVREQGQRTFERFLAGYTPDAAGVHRLVDSTLDHFLRRPQDAGLWMQRRMKDAADLSVEQRYAVPQLTEALRRTREVFRPELDATLVLQEIFWSVQNFIRGGLLDETGRVAGPDDPEAVARFRRHLHRLVDCLVREAD